MRISSIAIGLAVTLGPAFALPLLSGAAQAVQDRPVTIGGIETVCTGVGSAKDNPAWAAYPVKLVFANPAGENLAAVHVAVSQGARALVETDCDAPWLLMKLPAGSYAATATFASGTGPRIGKANFATKGSGQQTIDVVIGGGP